ncbi:DUF4396 domain-containing protein [Leifsonia soli]
MTDAFMQLLQLYRTLAAPRKDPITPPLAHFPGWFAVVATTSLLLGAACAVWVALDVVRRPQPMRVMAVVWPVTMLFGGLLGLWFYRAQGRAPRAGQEPSGRQTSLAASVGTGTSHCGAGCAIGDLIAEWLAFALPAVAVLGGWGWLFDDPMFAVWVIDFVLAFVIGIGFQYFAIAPMREQSAGRTLRDAVKADAASITAWQVGMFGVMALMQLLVFPVLWGGRAAVDSPEFWFAMQWAMLAGFATSYPVNWVLIRTGIKERM